MVKSVEIKRLISKCDYARETVIKNKYSNGSYSSYAGEVAKSEFKELKNALVNLYDELYREEIAREVLNNLKTTIVITD